MRSRGLGREPVGGPHLPGRRAVRERCGRELAAGLAVHDDLGQHERADRRLVLERTGDADHEHPTHGHRVEQPARAGGRELGAHAGDDRDHGAPVERSLVHRRRRRPASRSATTSRTSGSSSIGIANTKAIRPSRAGSTIGPACRIAAASGPLGSGGLGSAAHRSRESTVRTRLLIATASAVALLFPAACSSSSKDATPPPTTASTGPAPTRPLNRAVAVPKVTGPVTGGTPDIPDERDARRRTRRSTGTRSASSSSRAPRPRSPRTARSAKTASGRCSPGRRRRTRHASSCARPWTRRSSTARSWSSGSTRPPAATPIPTSASPGEQLLRDGFAYVGVTAQAVGVAVASTIPIPGYNPKGLVDQNPERYKSLHHPGDEYSYDIFSQAAQALLHPDGPSPLGSLQPQPSHRRR